MGVECKDDLPFGMTFMPRAFKKLFRISTIVLCMFIYIVWKFGSIMKLYFKKESE